MVAIIIRRKVSEEKGVFAMKNKSFYIAGGILCLIAVIFAAVAFTHPELSFPWKNWVSYTLYALYAVYTSLVFCMPKFKAPSLVACGIVAVEFIALALIVIYIGTRGTPNESGLYLLLGLLLTFFGNLTYLIMQKMKKSKIRKTTTNDKEDLK